MDYVDINNYFVSFFYRTLQRLMQLVAPQTKKDIGKMIIISYINGSSDNAIKKELNTNEEIIKTNSLCDKLIAEIKIIINKVVNLDEYKEIKTVIEEHNKINNTKCHTGTIISHILQNIEKDYVLQAITKCKENNIDVCTYIYDGFMVNETNIDKINIVLNELNSKSDIKFEIKNFKEKIDLINGIVYRSDENIVNDLKLFKRKFKHESDGTYSDTEATQLFIEIMNKKNYITLDNDEVYVFYEKNGLWSNSEDIIRAYIKKCPELGDYSQSNNKINTILTGIKSQIIADNSTPFDLITESLNRGDQYGKFLFNDGIYNAITRIFTPEFDSHIVFTKKINRSFKSREEIPIEIYNKINEELFINPFLNTENESPNGDFSKKILARALHGGFAIDKKIYFCLGNSNSSKGVTTVILKNCFGGYVREFNAEELKINSMISDSALKFKWLVELVGTRMAISNECNIETPLDGTVIKKLASGGSDEMQIRTLRQTQSSVVNKSTLFILCNDIPIIKPLDDAIVTRVCIIEYLKVFSDNPRDNYSLPKDYTIEKRYSDISGLYLNGYFHLICDQMYGWENPNEIRYPKLTDSIKEITESYIPPDGKIREILYENFEITGNPEDKIKTCDIIDKFKNLSVSPQKLGRELTKLKIGSINISDGHKMARYRTCIKFIERNTCEL